MMSDLFKELLVLAEEDSGEDKPPKQVWWSSPLGGFDDFDDPYKDEMIDGKTKMGPWANMTPKSWKQHGIGKLGQGYGQRYKKQPNGRWLKVEG